MKLAKKVSAPTVKKSTLTKSNTTRTDKQDTTANRMKYLTDMKNRLEENRKSIDEQISKLNREIAELSILPYKFDDKVVCKIKNRKGQLEETVGFISYIEDRSFPVVFYPYKKDGGLSSKYVFLYNGVKDIVRKAD